VNTVNVRKNAKLRDRFILFILSLAVYFFDCLFLPKQGITGIIGILSTRYTRYRTGYP
jgi:hypothetical protein